MRIVSLLPSATEIVCAIGSGEALVGRSHECDYPPGVERLPALTRPRFDVGGTSREIHERVGALAGTASGVYEIDRKVLRALRPTHVVTQAQCDVCAVSFDEVRETFSSWSDPPRIAALNPVDLAAIFGDIRQVGECLGARDRAESLAVALARRIETIRILVESAGRPRVVCLEWLDPPMAAGNWVPELVEIAGGEEVLGKPGRHSAWIGWEELRAADPDVVLVIPCGFSLGRVETEVSSSGRTFDWRRLRAFRSGRVYLGDGNSYFNRPGPRIAESLEILAEILHPELFDFGHRGSGWRPAGEVACARS